MRSYSVEVELIVPIKETFLVLAKSSEEANKRALESMVAKLPVDDQKKKLWSLRSTKTKAVDPN
jgi:hypothetical protein